MAVPPLVLAVIHGDVGLADHRFHRDAGVGRERDAKRRADPDLLRIVRDRIFQRGDQRRGQCVDLGARDGLEGQHRDELVAAEPRLGSGRGQDFVDALCGNLQHAVAGGVAVDVVDGLEMVEVEQEQRDVATLASRLRDHPLPLREQGTAVEEAGERIGVGEVARALFRLGAFADLAVQVLVAAPAEEDQRDIQDHRGGKHLVGPPTEADDRLHDRLHHAAAGADEQQDRGHDDPPGEHVAPRVLAAVARFRFCCHVNIPTHRCHSGGER